MPLPERIAKSTSPTLTRMKRFLENFKVAWTSTPVFFVSPSEGMKWLERALSSANYFFPNEKAVNELETDADIESFI